MICWTGSGYVFEQAKEHEIDGVAVYTALLKNGNATLHTAWWYDNGTSHTIGQLKWRWDVLRGAIDYSVVNVTAISEKELETAVACIRKNGAFSELLK
jgi:hypothetical protein